MCEMPPHKELLEDIKKRLEVGQGETVYQIGCGGEFKDCNCLENCIRVESKLT